MPTIRKLSGSS